jgi:hypothetical protein
MLNGSWASRRSNRANGAEIGRRFDEDYITALTIQTGNSGLILGQPSDPRLLGVTVRAQY